MNINLETTQHVYSVELNTTTVGVTIDDNFESGVVDVLVHWDGNFYSETDVIDGYLVKDITRAVCDVHFCTPVE